MIERRPFLSMIDPGWTILTGSLGETLPQDIVAHSPQQCSSI
jgi:hypothetical protein